MSEHSPDDPVGEDLPAGEYDADETEQSPETGTRYHPDGTPESTPEDERRAEEDA